MQHDIERLTRLAALVATKLADADAQAGPYQHADYFEWRKRKMRAEGDVQQFLATTEGAIFVERGNDHTVRMAGIRSTSTQDFAAALRNWRSAALVKINEAAEGDAVDPINLQGSGPAPIVPREG